MSPYTEIIGKIKGTDFFFFFAGLMGESLKFNFVCVDLKCILAIK